jgi:hypothetical protein
MLGQQGKTEIENKLIKYITHGFFVLAAPETSSGNSPRTPCKICKTKNQYLFHSETLKSRYVTQTTFHPAVS